MWCQPDFSWNEVMCVFEEIKSLMIFASEILFAPTTVFRKMTIIATTFLHTYFHFN